MIRARLDKKTRTHVLCGAMTDDRFICRGEFATIEYGAEPIGAVMSKPDGSSRGFDVSHEKCPRCGEMNEIDPLDLLDAWRFFTTFRA